MVAPAMPTERGWGFPREDAEVKAATIAIALQVGGMLGVSIGLWLIRPWMGILTLGVGLLVLGVALELGGKPASSPPFPAQFGSPPPADRPSDRTLFSWPRR
jgi:hypothetical protein